MDDPTDATRTDTGRAHPAYGAKRRRLIVGCAIAALVADCVIVASAAYLYARYNAPSLPPPTRQPLAQPGGTLRQVLGAPSPDSFEWSGDGEWLTFVADDSRHRFRILGYAHEGLRRAGWSRGTFPATIWCIGMVSADGTEHKTIRMPGGLNPFELCREPRGSRLAVRALRFRLDGRTVNEEWGLWLFDADRRRLGRRLHLDRREYALPMGWSPDGTRLIYAIVQSGTNEREYLVLDVGRGKVTKLPLPDPPIRSIGRVHWSPDSRFVALCRQVEPAADKSSHRGPTKGLWVVDMNAGEGTLIESESIGRVCWLSDGRLLVTASGWIDEDRTAAAVGVVDLKSRDVRWLPWWLDGLCWDIQEAHGRVVVELSRSFRTRDGRRASEQSLWQLSLNDGGPRRLTKLGDVGDWALSPRGNQIALSGGVLEKPLPGLWILDIEPSPDLARQQESGRGPVAE